MILTKNRAKLVCVIVISIYISSCTGIKYTIQPSQVPKSTITQALPTSEPKKSITVTISEIESMKSSTNLPSNSITLTPTPNEQARTDIWQNAMNSPVCQLPCWWNISPGITTWDETQEILKPLIIYPDSYTTKEGSIKHDATFHFFESNLYNYLELIEIKNNIKSLNVKGEGLQNPQEFREIWKRYTPAEILSMYGNPSRITIQTRKNTIQPSESTYKYYDLSLFYDHVGFVIIYSGKIENKPNYTICPTYSGNLLEEISIYSQSSESAVTLENIIGEDYGPNESAYSLFEASGLTLDQLANLITDKTRSACFDTKPEIWPP